MLAIDSSNPLRITVLLNQVQRRWNYCGRIRRSAAFLWMKTRLRPGFREAGRRRRICCRNWWMPESLVVSFAREHNSLESLFFHLTRGNGTEEPKHRNVPETRSDKEGTKRAVKSCI